MVELSVLVYLLIGFFAYVGYLRGWTKELIALSGVILSLFALHEFDNLIRVVVFGDLPPSQVFYVQTTLFILIVFFAYQTRALTERVGRRPDNRQESQTRILGAIVGGINGFLIGGTIWYFMDISNYPLAPQVIAPRPGFSSAALVDNLPLYMLTSGGDGTLLSLLVVILFVIVLVLI
jgi:uncharacterized membrane protein required for colicin V production